MSQCKAERLEVHNCLLEEGHRRSHKDGDGHAFRHNQSSNDTARDAIRGMRPEVIDGSYYFPMRAVLSVLDGK